MTVGAQPAKPPSYVRVSGRGTYVPRLSARNGGQGTGPGVEFDQDVLDVGGDGPLGNHQGAGYAAVGPALDEEAEERQLARVSPHRSPGGDTTTASTRW